MLQEIDVPQLVQNRIKAEAAKKGRQYSDRFGRAVGSYKEETFQKRKKDLLENGAQKLQEMFDAAAKQEYSFRNLRPQTNGLIYFNAEKAGEKLGGYVCPLGKMVIGLSPLRTEVFKISYGKHMKVTDKFLPVLLKREGLRK